MLTTVLGILMLGVLVFVHEFGHFIVAKFFNVKVLKFSLGFGPKLVSRTWGETEYMISAVPLGGYVQMLGEGKGEEGEEHAEELDDEEQCRSFAHQPPLKRIAIVSAGPLMNLLLPFLVLPLAFYVGVEVPAYIDQPACIGYVTPDSGAAKSGFVAGDCIETIQGEAIPTWNDANKALLSHAGDALQIRVQRGSDRVDLTMHPEDGGLEGLQSLGMYPPQQAVIGGLSQGMPAQVAGMQPGDKVLQIDDVVVSDWYAMRKVIQDGAGNEQLFVVDRKGERLEFSVAADKREDVGYLIGIGPQEPLVKKSYGPLEAFRKGAEQTRDLIGMTLVFIKKLVTGAVSSKYIGGPITVVKTAGEAAQISLSLLLSMLAFISIQLGILNLLPVPVLDGGHILFSLLELIFRRPLSLRVREAAQQVGLLLLLGLMVMAFYYDILRWFVGGP